MAIANPAQHKTCCKWPKDTAAAQTHENSLERNQ